MNVAPVRFTADVDAMRRFCEALGLQASVVADNGGWVSLSGGGGKLGLHPARTADEPRTVGETALSFETDEPLEAVQARLAAAGYEATSTRPSAGRFASSTRTASPS